METANAVVELAKALEELRSREQRRREYQKEYRAKKGREYYTKKNREWIGRKRAEKTPDPDTPKPLDT